MKIIPFLDDTFIVYCPITLGLNVFRWGLIDSSENILLKPQYHSKNAVINKYKKLLKKG